MTWFFTIKLEIIKLAPVFDDTCGKQRIESISFAGKWHKIWNGNNVKQNLKLNKVC